MIPREHLPLTLVTFALVGLLFLMYRELSAVKTAVAQLSVPPPAIRAVGEDESDAEDDDADDENDDDEVTDGATKPVGAVARAASAVRAGGAGGAGAAGAAGAAGRAMRAENREKSTDAPETALPRVSKHSVNSSSKDSALKLRK